MAPITLKTDLSLSLSLFKFHKFKPYYIEGKGTEIELICREHILHGVFSFHTMP